MRDSSFIPVHPSDLQNVHKHFATVGEQIDLGPLLGNPVDRYFGDGQRHPSCKKEYLDIERKTFAILHGKQSFRRILSEHLETALSVSYPWHGHDVDCLGKDSTEEYPVEGGYDLCFFWVCNNPGSDRNRVSLFHF